MSTDISAICDVRGFIGACLVDGDSGVMLESHVGAGGFDVDAAAAANAELMKAKTAAMKALGKEHGIGDVLITLGGQYHLVRPLSRNPGTFLFVALDRHTANLGMARLAVKKVEESIAA